MVLEAGSSPSTSVSPVRIIPPMLHKHIHLKLPITGRTQQEKPEDIQGGSNMTGTDLCVNKPHLRSSCATLRE